MLRRVQLSSGLLCKRYFHSSSIVCERIIPEPITKDNPRVKQRSLKYQKELEEYQNNPDPDLVIVPKDSIFEKEHIRKLVEDNATSPKGKKSRRGSDQYPYLIRVCIIYININLFNNNHQILIILNSMNINLLIKLELKQYQEKVVMDV